MMTVQQKAESRTRHSALSAQHSLTLPADVILHVEKLHVYFYTDLGLSRALNSVSFDLRAHRVLGVVGESGCGKSVTALSIMQLVPYPGRLVSGRIFLRVTHPQPGAGASAVDETVEITALERNSPQMRALRGGQIGMIFQEPMTSLNPSYTIGDQISEAILLHQLVSQSQATERAVSILERVGMPRPGDLVKRYPHELSGGMRQRVMIAMALSCNPAILIADEPTTALDVTTEAQILDLIRELQADLGMTSLFITHNLGVVAQMCDDVAVMYLGRIVEYASVDDLFYNPQHPYTKALLHSIPHIGSQAKARLQPIQGMVPDPYAKITGCPFHLRCPVAKSGVCDRRIPALSQVNPQHTVRCFLYSDEAEDESSQQ